MNDATFFRGVDHSSSTTLTVHSGTSVGSGYRNRESSASVNNDRSFANDRPSSSNLYRHQGGGVQVNNDRVAQRANERPSVRANFDARSDIWRSPRTGFHPYESRRFRGGRNGFFFNFYVGDYYPGAFWSPWYGYCQLPGYIAADRCRPDFYIHFGWGLGLAYCSDRWDRNWDNNYYSDNHYVEPGRDAELDNAIAEIQDSFRSGSAQSIDDLIPRNGWVSVDVDGRAPYSINSDDFYNMMKDAIETTKTSDFVVHEVYRNGGDVTLVTDHTFENSFGDSQTQRQWFGLRMVDGRYEIVSMRTSQ